MPCQVRLRYSYFIQIPNRNTLIWNASLSFKQANKHSKINKQNNFIFSYPTLILQQTKLSKLEKNCKIARSDKKIASVDDA